MKPERGTKGSNRIRLLPLLLISASPLLRGETDLEKAASLVKAGDTKAAQEVLAHAIQVDPRHAEALYQLSELQFLGGNSQLALVTLERAIRIAPGRAGFHVLRGQILGNQASKANLIKGYGLAKEGLAELEKAVQLEPSNGQARRALFDWYLKVPPLGGGGLDKAMAFANQTVAFYPAAGHTWKALAFLKKKDPGAVQREARLAIAADPAFAEAYNLLGYAELEMKQLDYALADFRKQVELAPNDPNSHDSLGDGLMAKGRVEEAIQSYRKGLTLNPKFWECAAHLGQALERAGRKDEAISHYRQYVQLGNQCGLPRVASMAKDRLKGLGVHE